MSSQDDSETDDLIQDECNYVSTKAYPADADKNRKRIIRRKALSGLAVRNGEVYYKKKKNEVFHQFTARLLQNTAIAKTEV